MNLTDKIKGLFGGTRDVAVIAPKVADKPADAWDSKEFREHMKVMRRKNRGTKGAPGAFGNKRLKFGQ